jgi:flagellar motor switch/type III secretory pathway protein FliN
MATKAPAPPQDDFNLDDIKLDDFPMEDNALFADLDNEMRADGGAGKAGGDDLDLNLDLGDSPGGDSMPALEEPGELKLDDTMDLDLNLDDPPKAESGAGDLDLNLDLDDGAKTGDADLKLDDGLDLNLDEGSKGGDDDLKLDGDLNLDEPAAESKGGDLDLDLDVGSVDLNLDSAEEPASDSLSMDEPSEPKFDMDLPEEPSLSLDMDAPAAEEPEGLSLSVVEPAASAMPEPELDMPELPPEPVAMAAAPAEPEMDLTLDDNFSLDNIPEASAGGDEPEASKEFQAAPDVNLDDIDLSLDSTGAEPAPLEPKGAQVNFQSADMSAPTMEEGFDLPPLAETKGDVESGPAEPFVAVPDVKLTEDEVLELNLPATEPHDDQPEFTMAPDDHMDMGMGGGMGAGEFRLTEPMSVDTGMAMNAPASAARASSPAMGQSMSPRMAAPMASREAAVSQDILLSIPHKISVQMGSVSLVGKDIRNLAYGSVVQLNRTVGEPVDLLLDGKSIAQGEIVLINGKNLGVRILALQK